MEAAVNDPAVQAASAQTVGFITNLITAMNHNPWFIAMILVAGVITLGLIFERFVRLYMQFNIDGASFMREIQNYILANDLDGAIRVCSGARGALLPKVVKAGLQRASRSEDQIQNAIDAMSLEVAPQLERRLPYLGMIANVATLLGLLGTISGLIVAFRAIEQADAAQRQAILAAGISEAMMATACGLLVAIAAMVAHSVLASKATRLLEEIDEFGVKLMDLLSARKYRHSSERTD